MSFDIEAMREAVAKHDKAARVQESIPLWKLSPAMAAEIERLTALSAAQAAEIARLRNDCAILITQIDFLRECTGEDLDAEDAQLVADIRLALEPRP